MAHRIFEHDRHEGIVMGWHEKTVIVPDLNLDNNWLTKWDLVPREIKDAQTGEKLPWVYLCCSDDESIRIGQPYNPETFQPVNNEHFLELVRKSIAGTGHKVVSVGSVRDRARVFVSIELMGMEKFKAAGREFSAYLNFGNGHDKSSVLWVNTSSVCTVCDNTFTANLVQVENNDSSKSNLNIAQRHSKNVIQKLPGIATLVDKAVGVQAEFAQAFDALAAVPCDSKEARSLFAGFLAQSRVEWRAKGLSTRALHTVDALENLFKTGKGNRGENLADAFSAVTDFYTHQSRGADQGGSVQRQVLSSEMGSARQAKQDFWNIVTSNGARLETRAVGRQVLEMVKVA